MTTPFFGRYEVKRLLGRGGMAEVYEGIHPDLGRRVAIKVVLSQLAETPGFEERFRREARLVASLRHPHIVQLYDFDLVDGRAFMVMEYLEGGSLEDRLHALRAQTRGQNETLPLSETARLLEAICAALDYAHARGVVHRDIKPGNILFMADGTPVLSDFGIARLGEGAVRLTATGGIVGSPAYMSPEQALGEQVDARSDIYALGVVLYEMTTGQPPFTADTPTAVLLKHIQQPPAPPSELNQNLPKAVEAVILQALAKNPTARFATACDLARAFRAALSGQMPAASAAPAIEAATLVDAAPTALPTAAPPSPLLIKPTPPPSPLPSVPSSPEPATPPEKRGRGWFTRVIDAADVVAPLVGERATERPTRSDRRGRLAALMGAIAIFVALLNFINDVFDLVNVGNWPLARIWPYLGAVSLVAGAALAVVALRHAATRQRRMQAGALLAVILLVALIWGGWAAFRRLQPPAQFLITVGQFDGRQASVKLDIARSIGDGLAAELREVHDQIVVERTAELVEDETQARRVGAARKSTLVIWGWYDDLRFRTFVELIRYPTLIQHGSTARLLAQSVAAAWQGASASASTPNLAQFSQYTRVPAAMPRLDFELDHASQQMTYVAATILGVGLYGSEEYESALALFDKALAHADPQGDELLGREKVYFHRAMALWALDREDEAVADLEQAVELKPDLYEAHHNLAIAYAQTCSPAWQIDQAIAEAETAVQLRPDEAAARRLLGDLYHQVGRESEAATVLQAATARDPQDALALRLLGDVYIALGNEQAAQQSYEQALAAAPAPSGSQTDGAQAATAAIARGDILVSAGRYQEAIAAYESVITTQPDHTQALNGLGNAYYWAGDTEKAIDAYLTWVKAVPADANARLLLGLALANTGQEDQAIPELEKAASLAACDPAAALVAAGLYWQKGNSARAEELYAQALTIDPQNADAHYVLGSIRYLDGNVEEAIPSLQKAVTLQPNFTDAYAMLGGIYTEQGAWQEAVSIYQKLAVLTPQEASVFTALGDAQFNLGQYADAADAYREALAVADSALVHVQLGLTLSFLGDLDGAVAQQQEALRLDPENVHAYQALGNALQQQGRYEEAAAAYQEALARTESAFGYTQLGTALSRLGRTAEAITAFQRSIELDPQSGDAYYQLGVAYANQGDLSDAENAYRQAIALDEDTALYQAALAQAAYGQCSLSLAVQAQSRAAALAPDIPSYQALLAALYEAQGREAEALPILDALIESAGDDFFVQSALADRFFRADQFDEAAGEYQQMLDRETAAPLALFLGHNGLGKVFLAQEKLLPARSEFEQALAAFPALGADPQMSLGDLSLLEGDVTAALAAYTQAAELLPAYQALNTFDQGMLAAVSLDVRRAIALARSGDSAGADAALKQAEEAAQAVVAKTPRSPLGRLALGMVYTASEQTELAAESFAVAAQCDQTLQETQVYLEQYLAKLRQP